MRTSHPFSMYDSILDQPKAIKEVINRNSDVINRLQKAIESAQRIFLVGTGTSYHAAWSSVFILRNKYPNEYFRAVQAIDFALYESDTKPTDLVIIFSHRGTKQYSLQSLERAKKNGSNTVLITGRNTSNFAAHLTIETAEQEESSAHTISYTTSVAIATAVADHKPEKLADLVAYGLKEERDIKKLAKQVKDARKIWIVGAGPSEVLAHETGLKIKETSYLQTEGVGTEELLHGPFQASQSDDLFIVVAPKGKAQSRTKQLLPAIHDIGAKSIVLSDETDNQTTLLAPSTNEELIPFSCLPFLQLLTYFVALDCGTNPDNFRLEDPRFEKAFKRNTM